MPGPRHFRKERVQDVDTSDPELSEKLSEQSIKGLRQTKFKGDVQKTPEAVERRKWMLRLLDFAESQTSLNELYRHNGHIADVDGGEYMSGLESILKNPVTGKKHTFTSPGLFLEEMRRIMRKNGVTEEEIKKFNARIKKAKDTAGVIEKRYSGEAAATGLIAIGPSHHLSGDEHEVPIPKYPVAREDIPGYLEKATIAGIKAASHLHSFRDLFPAGGGEILENDGLKYWHENQDKFHEAYVKATSLETLSEAEEKDKYDVCSRPFSKFYDGLFSGIEKRAQQLQRDEASRRMVDIPESKVSGAAVNDTAALAGLVGEAVRNMAGNTVFTTHNPEWALQDTMDRNVSKLSGMNSPLANSIITSMRAVQSHIIGNMMGDSTRGRLLAYLESLPDGVIPVGKDLADVVETKSFEEKIGGAVFGKSSIQAHNIINLRKAEVPTVVQVGDELLGRIKTWETLIVDDKEGVVIHHPDPDTIDEYRKRQSELVETRLKRSKNNHLPARSRDGREYVLQANVDSAEDWITMVHGNIYYGGDEYSFTASNVRDTVYRIDTDMGRRVPAMIYSGDVGSSVGEDMRENDRKVVEWVKNINVDNRDSSDEEAGRLGIDVIRWQRRSGAVGLGAQGSGLYRTEGILREFAAFPTPQEIQQIQYRELADLMVSYHREAKRNLDVFRLTNTSNTSGISHLESNMTADLDGRAFDVSGDKTAPEHMVGRLDGYGPEEVGNPLWMGATSLLLKNPEKLMKPQLKAFMMAAREGDELGINLRYVIPNVLTCEQVSQTVKIMEQSRTELAGQGTSCREPDLVVMMEDPTACTKQNLGEILEAGQGRIKAFKIGTNDMSYLAEMIDDMQAGRKPKPRKESSMDPLNSTVLKSVANITDVARQAGIPVTICGEAGGRSKFVPVFMALGVDHFSMSGISIPNIKREIRNLEAEKLELSRENMLRMSVTHPQKLHEWGEDIATAALET